MGTKKGGIKMKCPKIRPMIPLLAGGELPESKIPKVKEHLRGCSACRKEYEKYVFIVGQTRKWLGEDRIKWNEKEWRRTVQTAVNRETKRKSSLVPWPFPRAWAYAMMVGVVLLLTLLIIRPPFVQQIGMTPNDGDVAEVKRQEVVSMTMVSKETGLKIVWFFNKNFNLEENE
jgi:hypothetical protein